MLESMATEKQLEARKLREQGLNYEEIGARLGISRGAAHKRLHSPEIKHAWVGNVTANRQKVVALVKGQGPHGNQVWKMRCQDCGHEYGAYSSDVHLKKCPECQELAWGDGNRGGTKRPAEGPPIAGVAEELQRQVKRASRKSATKEQAG
jgi:hypothetical protein